MPQNWRQATPMERAEYVRWLNFYEGPVTKAVAGANIAAHVAGMTQDFIDKRQIPGIPPVITMEDADYMRGLLNTYNAVGRIVLGVNAGKYGIKIHQGDIDVLAPPTMPAEEFQDDIIQSMALSGAPLIVWAIVVGVTLVGGLWGGGEMMKASAEKERIKYKRAVLEADKAIMKQPQDVRQDWIQRRRDIEKYEQQEAAKTGILADIFGSKGGAWITAAAIALLALVAMRFVPKEK